MPHTCRGGSTLGCLVIFLLIGAGMYVGYKFALAQWDYEGMKEELTEIARYWVMQDHPDPEVIKQEIIRKAERHNVYLEKEDIEIQQMQGGMLIIDVSWVTPIVFPGGYVYERFFSIHKQIKRY
ncbi:MAG: hypothetical protein N3B18_09840 [Desulfobacterota bacterium]|nr:hypothetical protein [Thermodesulfobacteriota bacterium]